MFYCNKEEYHSELFNIVRQFKRHEQAEISCLFCVEKLTINVGDSALKSPKNFLFQFDFKTKTKKEALFFLKTTLYNVLKSHFNESLPWGALTGVRPTKLVYEALNLGKTLDDAKENLINNYFVSPKKAGLACEIVKNQKPYLLTNEEKNNLVNLYVHIPFCPSRCNYCSFVSLSSRKFSHLIEMYFEKLIIELEQDLTILKSQNKKICSIYIGGGTPSCLPIPMIEKLFAVLKPYSNDCEITFEAGRADTITPELLDALHEKATRICLNPQTLSDTTLKKIGREHTAEEFFTAFNLIKKLNFVVNCDLIYGIDESEEDFLMTLEKVLALRPENITIHTLSNKKGAKMEQEVKSDKTAQESIVCPQQRFESQLALHGYHPYYLYRQKEQLSSLENVGYSLLNHECKNNISVMEETLSIMASGAGAISKKIIRSETNTKIARLSNLRDVQLYLDRFDETLEKKESFFKS
ncbi:MAG: coproporphyrinogen dehydrogenase HemZ [Firmicutes bacterium]|nr:coproporphyrinogen dehydrogenase HemZ [Bacillota bacterium]